MRIVLIYFVCLSNALTSYAQIVDSPSLGKATGSIRGYTYWERLQARVNTKCHINPLDSNTFIKKQKIKTINAYIYFDSTHSYLADTWIYGEQGFLSLFQTSFSKIKYQTHEGRIFAKDTLYPTHIKEFKYNSQGFLIGVESKTVAIVEPMHLGSCQWVQPDSVILKYNKIGLASSKQIAKDHNCYEEFIINDQGLLQLVSYYEDGQFLYSIKFEFCFW